MLLPYVLTFAAFFAGVLAGALGVNRVLWIFRVGYPLAREAVTKGELADPRRVTRSFPLSAGAWTGMVILLSVWFVRETVLIYAVFYFFGLVLSSAVGVLTSRRNDDARRRFRQTYRNEFQHALAPDGAGPITQNPEEAGPPEGQNRSEPHRNPLA